MPILSTNPMWEMFGQRALSTTFYGGADIGEQAVDDVADPKAMQEQHALQSRMLFATLPQDGPSLCVLSMGPRDCP